MPFQPTPRASAVLASTLAAGLMLLTVASCASHVTPLGPAPTQLGSPIILQAVRSQPHGPAAGCPAGWVALPGPGGAGSACYRKLGRPMRITSAEVGPVASPAQQGASQPPAPTAIMITVPPADVAALTAVTTTAQSAQGYLDVSVAGRSWIMPRVLRPFTGPHFEILLPSASQALRLQRTLSAP
jgi:hypothetical protein